MSFHFVYTILVLSPSGTVRGSYVSCEISFNFKHLAVFVAFISTVSLMLHSFLPYWLNMSSSAAGGQRTIVQTSVWDPTDANSILTLCSSLESLIASISCTDWENLRSLWFHATNSVLSHIISLLPSITEAPMHWLLMLVMLVSHDNAPYSWTFMFVYIVMMPSFVCRARIRWYQIMVQISQYTYQFPW